MCSLDSLSPDHCGLPAAEDRSAGAPVPLTAARAPDGRALTEAPQETHTWHDAYRSPAQRRRRRRAFPRKLRLLGIDRADRRSRVLDVCCGHGEALEELYALGFRHLVGLDITLDAALVADGRFEIHQADARDTGLPDTSFDWILNIHSMHHLGMAPDIERFINECWRLLKPGGRLSIIDFSDSPQIRLAFWWFRQSWCQWTSYLKTFGRMVSEEWCFLKDYLPQFPAVWRCLLGSRFRVESLRRGLFYFYLTLGKEADGT